MPNQSKVAKVEALKEQFEQSTSVIVTEYRGLSVSQIKELRESLGSASYVVAKNTLVKIAANQTGISELDDDLQGPSAFVFVNGDPVEAAKGLKKFAKDNPELVIKSGIIDGQYSDSDQIDKIADLDSREVLLAKLAGAMKQSMAKAVYLFIQPATKFARLGKALEEKKEQEQ